MHSFRQSRGRIFFDFLCVLVIVASCAGAWMQTGASALLGVAAAAGLYGLVHLFDMRSPVSAVELEPQRIDFATEAKGEVAAELNAEEPPAVAGPPLVIDRTPNPEFVEQAASRAKPVRKAKASGKGGGRRAGGVRDAEVIELAQPEETEVSGLTPPEVAESADIDIDDGVSHQHIEPLFEPERFGRMPRRAFGRRGQL